MKKGQMNASGIIPGVVLLMMVGFVGIISLTIYDSIEGSLKDSLSATTADSYYTLQNFSENTYDGYDLASNVPIVMAAGLLIMVIVGFGLYLR